MCTSPSPEGGCASPHFTTRRSRSLNYELLSDLRQVHSNEGTNRVDTNGLLIFGSALTSEMHAGDEMVS